MDPYRIPRRFPVASGLASLIIAALALANSTLWASSRCWAWNGLGFFEGAGGADVVRCLDIGKSLTDRDFRGLTPLHCAAEGDDPRNVAFLLEMGLDPGASDRGGKTPLHDAAAWGKPENIVLLGEAGTPVNVRDGRGWPPLHLAAGYGSAENVVALLVAGADPAITDRNGKFALDHAKSRKRILDGETFRRPDPSGGVLPAGR